MTPAAGLARLAAQPQVIHVELAYRAPVNGPTPNFSPKGTQVTLAPVADTRPLPAGAVRPAKAGAIKVGPSEASWIPVLATADAAHPRTSCACSRPESQRQLRRRRPGADRRALAEREDQGVVDVLQQGRAVGPLRGAGRRAVPRQLLDRARRRRAGAGHPPLFGRLVARRARSRSTASQALVAAMDSDNDAMFEQERHVERARGRRRPTPRRRCSRSPRRADQPLHVREGRQPRTRARVPVVQPGRPLASTSPSSIGR